jgi:hypothetical protein
MTPEATTASGTEGAGVISNKLVTAVVIAVTAVWAITCVVSIVLLVVRADAATNSLFLQVNGTFAAIAGGSIAAALKRRNNGDGGDSS